MKTAAILSTIATAGIVSASPLSRRAPAHFKYFGVDESVAEFGQQNIPGTWGKDFYFPSNDALDVRRIFSVYEIVSRANIALRLS